MLNFTFFKKAKLAFFVAFSIAFAFSKTVSAQRIFALSGNDLISFDANSPTATVASVGSVSGIAAGQMLAGIDFRPATGELYGIGYNSATGDARIYTINMTTAAATAIGAASITVAANMGAVTFDFNPTVDRIRFMGSGNQNYRLHPVTGAIAATDGNLAFSATDANAGVDPEIATGAYSNSYIASTSTVLYNFDSKLGIFTTQNPPNNGTQNTVGSAGLTINQADPSVSLDVFYDAAAGMNRFFLAANTGSAANDDLFSINISTGAATMIGSIGMPIRDIAAQITRSVPTLAGDLLYALTSNNMLVSFDATAPTIIRTAVAVTGLTMGQTLAGMDFRPATGELYALGYAATTGEGRLYTIKLSSGVATPVGAAVFSLAPNLGKIGMDFNPFVDRIRVTSSANFNYRLHPTTGALAATDLPLNFSATDANAGKNPSVGASAYSNSFAGTASTTLFNYDDSLNVLLTQVPPNDGRLNTIGASGVAVNLADPTSDLDVFYDKATLSNRAYFVANVGTSVFDDLFSINLTTGAATLVGRVGNGSAIVDVAARIAPSLFMPCPANISVTAPQGAASMVVNYVAPTAASGCADGFSAATKTSGLASGAAFPGGVNSVCFAATDNCGNSVSCCFTVTVVETPCATKSSGCMKFDILSITKNAAGNKVMRMRVANGCTSPMSYVAFQVQNGLQAVSPANNATYSAPSGNLYTVRNLNPTPFPSIRFKPQAEGIKNGQSDVFEYVLPNFTSLSAFKIFAKLDDGSNFTVLLSTTACGTTAFFAPDETGLESEMIEQKVEERQLFSQNEKGWSVAPNPSAGELLVDLSDFSGETATLTAFDLTGKMVGRRVIENLGDGFFDFSDLVADWQNGLYFIEVKTANGQRERAKWLLQR